MRTDSFTARQEPQYTKEMPGPAAPGVREIIVVA